jgi:hypothetical protein
MLSIAARERQNRVHGILVSMRELTPQEKKRLSLERDRRNVFGEAPHASRKNVPLRKKLRNRANRHFQEAQLPVVLTQIDSEQGDLIASSMHAKAPQVWKKYADRPLGEVLTEKRQKRATPKSERITIIPLGRPKP